MGVSGSAGEGLQPSPNPLLSLDDLNFHSFSLSVNAPLSYITTKIEVKMAWRDRPDTYFLEFFFGGRIDGGNEFYYRHRVNPDMLEDDDISHNELSVHLSIISLDEMSKEVAIPPGLYDLVIDLAKQCSPPTGSVSRTLYLPAEQEYTTTPKETAEIPSKEYKIWDFFPALNETVKDSPCGCSGFAVNKISTIIMHLNDKCKWTREDIADWLESLDIDIGMKDVNPKMKNAIPGSKEECYYCGDSDINAVYFGNPVCTKHKG